MSMNPRNLNPGRNSNLIVPGQNGGGIQDPGFRNNNLGNGVGRGMGLAANLGGASGMINNAQVGAGFSSKASVASRIDFNATQKSSSKYSSAVERSTSASSYSSQNLESTHQSLRYALGSVPWMKFKIIAEPDLGAFMNNPQLEAFIRSITETTMSKVTEDIVAEFTATLQQAIERTNETITTRLSNVTESVITQITSLTNVGGVSTELGILDFGNYGYGGDENIDIQGGGGGGGGGGGNIDIWGGGGAVIIEEPTVVINLFDNCGKDHNDDCNEDDNCPCPPRNSCPAIHHDLEAEMVAPPDLSKANWIWTQEIITNPTPKGEARPFRKVIKTKCPVNHVTVDITCDNFYTLYVNGKLVGSGINFMIAQRYTVEFDQTTEVVIAVYAVQDPVTQAQVGLLCAGVVWHSQTRPPVRTLFITDETWKTVSGNGFESDFYKQRFVDGGWENAKSEGPYMTTPPWAGRVIMPTKSETQNGPAWKNTIPGNPIRNAPDAKLATLVASESDENSWAPTEKDKDTDKDTHGTASSKNSKEPKGREGRAAKS